MNIRIQILTQRIINLSFNRILSYKPPDTRIIIACTQIVKPDFRIIYFSGVLEGIGGALHLTRSSTFVSSLQEKTTWSTRLTCGYIDYFSYNVTVNPSSPIISLPTSTIMFFSGKISLALLLQ